MSTDTVGSARVAGWGGAVAVGAVATMVFLAASAVAVVYDDEASFADPARSAALGHSFGSPAMTGVLPGAEERVLWQPPGYLLLLAGWFRIFGFGLIQGRALSAVTAGLAVGLIYVFASRYVPRGFAGLAAGVVALSPWALRAATAIRPDSAALMCVMLSVVAVLSWVDRPTPRGAAWMALGVAGASLMHPIGAMAGLFVGTYLMSRRRWWTAGVVLTVAVVVVVVVWGSYVAGHWPAFLEQMRLQGARKTGVDVLALWTSQDMVRRLGYMGFVAGIGVLLWKRRRVPWAPTLALVVAALAATFGREEQYPVYVMALGAPFIAMGAVEVARLRAGVATTFTVCVLLVALAPSVLFVARGVRDIGAHEALVAATGARPVFLGPGAAVLYFADPARARIFVPVPVESAAVAQTARLQGIVVTSSAPPRGLSVDRLTDVYGRAVWVVR